MATHSVPFGRILVPLDSCFGGVQLKLNATLNSNSVSHTITTPPPVKETLSLSSERRVVQRLCGWTRLGPESMSRRHQNQRIQIQFCVFFVTRTRITSSTRHLESVLALTRHLIRLLAVRINSRVGDKNTLSWCLCSIKIEHAYTSHPLDTLVSDMHALTTVSEGEGSVCALNFNSVPHFSNKNGMV